MRVGFYHSAGDSSSPELWSGTPHGLSTGLEAVGVEVVRYAGVSTRQSALPTRVRAHVGALRSGEIGRFRGIVADRGRSMRRRRAALLSEQIAGTGPLDAVVVIGADSIDVGGVYTGGAPVITYEDATLAQMWAHPDSDTRLLAVADRHAKEWISAQRVSSLAASGVAVSTAWAARSFVEDFGVPSDLVHVVGMGHRPRVRDLAAARPGRPVFLFVGVDWVRKNGAAVMAAFARVRAEVTEAELHLVGGHPEVCGHGVTGYGVLRRDSPRDQAVLDHLFATSTAFVLPSLFDPSPIAYLEAASAGLPVVATDQGGAGGMLGEGAIVVNPHDAEALYRAMRSLCDERHARARGELAHDAASRASWSHVATRLMEVASALHSRP